MERAEYIKKEFIDAQSAEVSATANGAAAQKPKPGGGGGKDEVDPAGDWSLNRFARCWLFCDSGMIYKSFVVNG